MAPSAKSVEDQPVPKRGWLRPLCATVLAPAAVYFVLHCLAYRAMQSRGWFDSWEYTTRGDRRLGFRLRPSVSNNFSGVVVHTNADGFRSPSSSSHALPKAPGESLVVIAGDSTTFGVLTPYELTYAALLEQQLRRTLGRPVRVLNLGVPGYSLEQTVATVEDWAHLRPDVVIVTVNGLNDRVFVGRADSPQMLARDYRVLRPYEFGNLISYPLLYWYERTHKQSNLPALPDLARGIPVPRVPLDRYQTLLEQLARSAKQRGTRLILLSTGDPLDSPLAREGLGALNVGHWDEALSAFERMHAARPALFLPAFYAYHCALELRRWDQAAAIRGRYEAAYRALRDPYLTSFSYFASEYAPVLESVASRAQVTLLDFQDQFQRSDYFRELGHFGPPGHAAVAEGLTPLVAAMLADPSTPDPRHATGQSEAR